MICLDLFEVYFLNLILMYCNTYNELAELFWTFHRHGQIELF